MDEIGMCPDCQQFAFLVKPEGSGKLVMADHPGRIQSKCSGINKHPTSHTTRSTLIAELRENIKSRPGYCPLGGWSIFPPSILEEVDPRLASSAGGA